MIALSAFVAWIAIIAFSLCPKVMTTMDMLFVFFVDTICELSVFSVLHLDLKFIQVTPGTANGISDLVFRLIELPILLVTTSNLLLNPSKIFKWGGVCGIIAFSLLVQQTIAWMGVISFHHWNIVCSGLVFCATVALSSLFTWIIMRTAPRTA